LINLRKRYHWVVLATLALVGIIVAGWFVAARFQPDAASLLEKLPHGADAYLVLDLQKLQSNPAVRKLLADPPDNLPTADYADLLANTGFRYQDDLKQLAAAKVGPDWIGVARIRIDRARVVPYLESQGATSQQHNSTMIYTFGTERPFRLAFPAEDVAMFSIGPDSNLLTGALDRHTGGSSGSAGDELRRTGLLTSTARQRAFWFVGDTSRLYAANPDGPRAGPFLFSQDWFAGSRQITAWIESSALNLEVELQSQHETADSAARSANAFKAVLAVLQAIPAQPSRGAEQDYSRLLAGISIAQAGDSVTLHWRLEPGMLVSLAR
jgi:hypothetical protein